MNKNKITDDKNDEESQWVTFSLEKENYAIRVLKVIEIQRHSGISSIPNASPHVLGIINLRGKIICVIDTRAKFGLPDFEITDNTRIIIIEANENMIGLLVDDVDEVITIKQSEINDAPNIGSNKKAPFIESVYYINNKLVVLLNLDRILSNDEFQEITSL